MPRLDYEPITLTFSSIVIACLQMNDLASDDENTRSSRVVAPMSMRCTVRGNLIRDASDIEISANRCIYNQIIEDHGALSAQLPP